MTRGLVGAMVIGLAAAAPLAAGGRGTVSGAYVEARTAEVFTGGCIMGSEAETMGKQAELAWKVDRGTFNGVAVDGLAVVAALAGDRNLGLQWFHPLAIVDRARHGPHGRTRVHRDGARHEVERSEPAVRLLRNLQLLAAP